MSTSVSIHLMTQRSDNLIIFGNNTKVLIMDIKSNTCSERTNILPARGATMLFVWFIVVHTLVMITHSTKHRECHDNQ